MIRSYLNGRLPRVASYSPFFLTRAFGEAAWQRVSLNVLGRVNDVDNGDVDDEDRGDDGGIAGVTSLGDCINRLPVRRREAKS